MDHFSSAYAGLRELALFAGAGGGILGGKLLGWRTVCAVEYEPYAASVLVQRQNDGLLQTFPIWDDVRTFDGRSWRGIVDVVSGGFPCQDISVAGKGVGITGERSGLWSHMARIIGEVRPRFAFVENSPALLTLGLGVVLGDLAALGYDARWTVLGAADVGAPHRRDRLWLVAADSERIRPGAGKTPEVRRALHDELGISSEKERGRYELESRTSCGNSDVADANSLRELQPQGSERHERGWISDCGSDVADSNSTQRERRSLASRIREEYADIGGSSWWQSEPDVGRVANGVAARVDRLKAIGNGQVPLCAATAFSELAAAFD